MIDYHIHTPLCKHAKGSMILYVQKAIEKGLTEICFLDHLTLDKNEKVLSMDIDDVSLYFQAVQTLKYKYKDIIKIKAGLEVDFNENYINLIEDVIGTYSFDIIGSSVHFIKGYNVVSQRFIKNLDNVNIDYIYELYFDKLYKMLDYKYFDVICHLDVIKKLSLPFSLITIEKNIKNLDLILNKIAYKNLTVEINTSGYKHPVREIYPSFSIIKSCKQKGIHITLGSDSHEPDSIGSFYDKALQIICRAGYENICGFNKRNPYPIRIDCSQY